MTEEQFEREQLREESILEEWDDTESIASCQLCDDEDEGDIRKTFNTSVSAVFKILLHIYFSKVIILAGHY